MIWLWVVIAVGLIALAILCLSFIQGEVHFARAVEQDHLELVINAFWGLKTKRFFPMIKLIHISKQIPFASEKSESAPEANHAKKPHAKGKMKGSFQKARLLMQNTVHGIQWLKLTLSRIECTQLNWITRVGLGDAAHTAVTTGAIWALKTSSLGFMMHFVKVKSRPLVHVVPHYNQQLFATDFHGAAGIRIIYILWAGIELVWRVLKIKGGLKTWYRVMTQSKVANKHT